MTNKLKKLIYVGVVLIVCVGILCACNNDDKVDNRYNAVLYDNVIVNLNVEYLQEYSTKGTIVEDEFPIEDNRAETNVQIISNQQTFSKAFNSFFNEVNFDQDMIVLYFFTGIPAKSPTGNVKFYEYSIKNIEYENMKLKIVLNARYLISDERPVGLPPTQVVFAIKMNYLIFDEIDICFS